MSGFHLFTLAKIPIWVSPWFLVIPLLAVQSMGVRHGLAFAASALLSVVAHEFGHAVMARRYRLAPQIMVHAYGGHTAHQPARTRGQEGVITAAGPLSGLALGALAFAALSALTTSKNVGVLGLMRAFVAGHLMLREAPLTVNVLLTLVFLNVLWSGFNLLPVWPLDGGRLLRLSLGKVAKPLRADRITHVLGLLAVAGLALFAHRHPSVAFGGMYTMILLAWLGFRNLQGLTASPNAQPVRKDNGFARELMLAAERAYERNEDEEAARLCHQIRAENNVPPAVLAHTWAMLGVIATRRGHFEEALSYLRRAPDAPDVVEATAQCFYQLGMYDALSALTATRAFNRLPNETRRTILDALHEAVA
jgi:Zn-dependent protease